MRWERICYRTDAGTEVETTPEGVVTSGPPDLIGLVVVRSRTSSRLFTNPEGRDLGRVVRHVMIGPPKVTASTLDLDQRRAIPLTRGTQRRRRDGTT